MKTSRSDRADQVEHVQRARASDRPSERSARSCACVSGWRACIGRARLRTGRPDGARLARGGANRPPMAAMPPPMTKPGDGRADQDLALVAARICWRQSVTTATSPRRRSSERAELGAVGLDRRADLLGGALGGHLDRRLRIEDFTVSLIALGLVDRHRRASAASPHLSKRDGDEARRAPPRMNRTPATMKKPQKNWCRPGPGSPTRPATRSRAGSGRSAEDREDAGGGADAAPLASLVTFSVTSALASSISSRTSSEALLGDLVDRLRRCACGLLVGQSSAAKALEDHGGEQAAGERGADERPRGRSADELRRTPWAPPKWRSRRQATVGGGLGPGVRRAVEVAAHSGGSSPKRGGKPWRRPAWWRCWRARRCRRAGRTRRGA